MPKNNTTKKAVVASVKYAGFEFPGLQLPDVNYAIAVTQVVELFQRSNQGFQFYKRQASRGIKYLLGNGSQFYKSAKNYSDCSFSLVFNHSLTACLTNSATGTPVFSEQLTSLFSSGFGKRTDITLLPREEYSTNLPSLFLGLFTVAFNGFLWLAIANSSMNFK